MDFNGIEQFMEQFKILLINPWVACFAALWLIGYLVKNSTKLPNEYIPLVLSVLGAGLGFALLEQSLMGIIAGAYIGGIVIVGAHALVKPAGKLINK